MFKKASEVQLADPQVEVREQPFQILHGAVEQPRQGTGDDRAELPVGEERDQHAHDAGEDHGRIIELLMRKNELYIRITCENVI